MPAAKPAPSRSIGIEGPDGPTAHLLDAQQQLWIGDAAALAKAADQLP